MKLENKNILVTGASRGIGAAIVKELLKHKTGKIYAAARKMGGLPKFGDGRVMPVELDITNEKQVSAAAKTAKDVNVLINNAGILHFSSMLDGSIEDIKADMDTNYYGTLSMVRAFVPVLEKNGHGLIANVGSVAGLAAISMIGGYSASKFALSALTQSLRAELASKGIRVSGIYPGPIDTGMAKNFAMEKASPESTAELIVKGLIAGDEYIFPDRMSQDWGRLWMKDPVALEKQFAVPPATAKEAA
ncbi:MAG: SDR family oxidoreductase [Alphaproteobacteria bacterium]|nr:SDR family oxidoreductase [Alphaproteobacteria bacterium]